VIAELFKIYHIIHNLSVSKDRAHEGACVPPPAARRQLSPIYHPSIRYYPRPLISESIIAAS